MNLDELTEQELIAKFLLTSQEHQNEISKALYMRYYEEFERRIVAVLRVKNVIYSPSDEYFLKILTSVHHRVFDIKRLEKKLLKFDSRKGSFRGWLLGSVVPNELNDFLKEVDPTSGLKNIDQIRNEQKISKESISIYSPVSEDYSETFESKIPSNSNKVPFEEEAENKLDIILNKVAIKEKVYLKLLTIAYNELTTEEIKDVGVVNEREYDENKRSLDELRASLVQSEKFIYALKVDEKIMCLSEIIRMLQSRIYKLEESLLQCCTKEERAENSLEKSPLRLKDLEEKAKKLRLEFTNKKISVDKYYKERQINSLKINSKRLKKVEKKREALLRDKASGKFFIRPSYKDISNILGVSEGAVGSQLARTFKFLRKSSGEEALFASSNME